MSDCGQVAVLYDTSNIVTCYCLVSVCRKVLSSTFSAYCSGVLAACQDMVEWINKVSLHVYLWLLTLWVAYETWGPSKYSQVCVGKATCTPSTRQTYQCDINISHYSDVTWALWGLKSLAKFDCCFNSLFKLTAINASKLNIHGPLSGAWTSWHIVISTAYL